MSSASRSGSVLGKRIENRPVYGVLTPLASVTHTVSRAEAAQALRDSVAKAAARLRTIARSESAPSGSPVT